MIQQDLKIFNTLSKKKELFQPINKKYVGMYVCGPTVYGDTHLGHARPAITFDVLYRYLKILGYKVRYVRNITDVGHLEEEIGEGEDKIEKKARLEKLEPMEVVKYYSDRFHKNLEALNVLPPSIEPLASGHILEQQEAIQEIVKKGYAYERNGSVYFDVKKYAKEHPYGELSGRNIDDLLQNTRQLSGQDEKKNSYDFALWKKADTKHIMRWKSHWSEGFPGWHTECAAMSTKYLGTEFDIHGGGLDLLFPHHECELAHFNTLNGNKGARYWMHNNMITINGQKMGKSLGNFITLNKFFTGEHKLLDQAYDPMTIRFFILQAHYRSTLDFSNEALQAAEKGYQKLMTAVSTIEQLPERDATSVDVQQIEKNCYKAINDDLNSPILIAHLFDGVKTINQIATSKATITKEDKQHLRKIFHKFVYDILGLRSQKKEENSQLLDNVIDFILNIRQQEKQNKNFKVSDKIRDGLSQLGVKVYDKKDGSDWEI